ncbi:MAG: RHS repeat-associated core domain-containing protein [Lachnospiraceae bacterium]|nr:RHS repeat-associated core domain-containing protein [Lachnospiraceae bacterium]
MSSITHIVGITHEMGEDHVLNHYEYDAWGNTTVCEETVENRFRFNGQQYDPITQQYYLRARFYNPVIARFTQEDTYRGDGLNLYAYCRNNPVYYIDPSGHMPACMKEAYDKALAEGKSKAEAYKLAKQAYWEGQARARQEAEQQALQEMNILHKPISEWSADELQRAVDSIHNAQFNGSWFGNLSPMAVTVDQGGRVVVTKNGGPVRADSPAGQMAIKIFGPDVEFPSGRGSNYPRVNGDPRNRHAEARGIQAFIHGDTSIVFGKDEVRQACSHYSCGSTNPNRGCAGKITQHNVTPITDFAQAHNGRIGRSYISNLWYL